MAVLSPAARYTDPARASSPWQPARGHSVAPNVKEKGECGEYTCIDKDWPSRAAGRRFRRTRKTLARPFSLCRLDLPALGSSRRKRVTVGDGGGPQASCDDGPLFPTSCLFFFPLASTALHLFVRWA
ncbi:hypothetical protein CDD83_6610 [Cordyceps sp. RAO-2017]|nr:hypothetical protein CDD83_6610 [Cordyceps sp. RAO-2017]